MTVMAAKMGLSPLAARNMSQSPPRRAHKPRREEVPPGACLCDHCPAKCCRYFALTIEEPRDWEDFDFIRWYLLHERAAVFVEDGAWFLLVNNRCKHLGDDNRCRIYHTRPEICRGYNTRNCEYEDDWVYDHLWETPEQVEEYAEAVLGPRKGKNIRSRKPK
jgi:Fe-S-cluster containining protein